MPVGYHRDVSAASPPGSPTHIGSAGRSASRRLVTRGDEFVEIAEGPPLLPRFTPAGNFALCRCVEQNPAKGRLRSQSHSEDRVEAEAATVTVQRENEHQHKRNKYVKATRPCAVEAATD